MSPYVWIPTCMFECPPHVWTPPCLDTLLNVWMPPYGWIPPYIWALLCLDAPCMFGHPHMFGCPCMFGRCLDAHCTYTTQRKHALSRLRGCPYAPYIWMPPVCLDTPICLDVPHTFGCIHTFGGNPNIQGAAKHMEGIQTYGGVQICGAI